MAWDIGFSLRVTRSRAPAVRRKKASDGRSIISVEPSGKAKWNHAANEISLETGKSLTVNQIMIEYQYDNEIRFVTGI
jgi:hypothetical protein